VDRISASIKLYPERFMSKTRILETKSLADFDMNLANPEVFARAQKEILGEECSYPMIAFGTMQPKEAFKTYARVKNIEFETANTISKQIEQYEKDLKHAEEDEKETIDILDYIEQKYHETFLGSKKYLGIISNVKVAPCAYAVYSGNIRKEIGLIRLNSANGNQHICTIMDGLWAENYKFLKNDLLKVSVVELIDSIYKRIGINPHTVDELLKACDKNTKVWDVYKNGWTMGINQVEQYGTRSRASKYAPTNISELSAFVAAVRPGFASMYKIFENREPFSYGIESFDNLIKTPELPMSFILYQEQSMATLNYAGIPMTECYEIIKNIAKKRVEKVLKYKEIFLEGFSKRIIEDENKTEEDAYVLSHKTWKILEDSSNYSFNASHAYCVALDSLYGAYLKSHYPLEFYEAFMRILEDGGDKDRLSATKEEAERAYHIIFPKFSFGQDNRNIIGNSANKSITPSLKSIKGFGNEIGNNMFWLSENFKGNDFIDLLVFSKESSMFSSKFESLIKIGYFDNFGHNKKLLFIYNEFKSGKNKYDKKLKDITKQKRIDKLKEMFSNTENERIDFIDQIIAEEEILGYIQFTAPKISAKYAYVKELQIKFADNGKRIAPRIQVYGLKSGKEASLKITNPVFDNHPFKEGDILFCEILEAKYPKKHVGNNVFVDDTSNGKTQWWVDKYSVFTLDKFNEVLMMETTKNDK
jgi:DNA polymerase III alpha subunit